MDASFITEFLNAALRLDAKLSSHPVEVECSDANMINQVSPVSNTLSRPIFLQN